MKENVYHEIKLTDECAGARLDSALARLLPQYSRSKIKEWIDAGLITINGKEGKPKDKVKSGDNIVIAAHLEKQQTDTPENIKLDFVYEDDDIIIINKPAGLVVHPAVGNYAGTLLNALLYHDTNLAKLPRAGIIHRLDKETSGLMLITKTLEAHTFLVRQLQKRHITRQYKAIVCGRLISGGQVDAPIGRHPRLRTHMAVVDSGKEAVTHYRILQRFNNYTLLDVTLETGRTHQIRVHMAHKKYPIVGDKTYGGRLHFAKGESAEVIEAIRHLPRQALHAYKLGFTHPTTREHVEYVVKLPDDLENLLQILTRNG